MMTLGLVLTFTTSWVAYQGVVWNLAVGAPDQLLHRGDEIVGHGAADASVRELDHVLLAAGLVAAGSQRMRA